MVRFAIPQPTGLLLPLPGTQAFRHISENSALNALHKRADNALVKPSGFRGTVIFLRYLWIHCAAHGQPLTLSEGKGGPFLGVRTLAKRRSTLHWLQFSQHGLSRVCARLAASLSSRERCPVVEGER